MSMFFTKYVYYREITKVFKHWKQLENWRKPLNDCGFL